MSHLTSPHSSRHTSLQQSLRWLISQIGTLSFLLLSLGTVLAANTNPIVIHNDTATIEETKRLELPVTISRSNANGDMILSLRAWLRADVFAGYRRGFKIYWDGRELTKAIGLPDTFMMRDGRETVMYHEPDGWTIPFADTADQFLEARENGYYPIEPEFVPGVFQFLIENPGDGQHTLVIEHTATVPNDLLVSSITLEHNDK